MPKVKSITEGPIVSTIFRLAWPVVASMFLELALSITDYFWVGFLGTPEQDAITTSMIVTWTVFATIAIVITGLTALVSRAIGANDTPAAAYVSKQGIQLGIGIGLVFSTLGFTLTPAILDFMKAAPNVVAIGVPYLRIYFLAMVFLFVNDALGAIFRATGNTKSPTIAFAAGTVINIILDPILIFGWGPIPAMGVVGAAIATSLSVVICFIIFIIVLYKNQLEFSLRDWYRRKTDFAMIRKIIKIGLPISLQNLIFVFIYWFLIQLVHHYGDAAGAAMGVGHRMEALSYLVAVAFSVAASTLVGQNLGAKKTERAARCAWWTVGIIVAETLVVSILFISIPRVIAGIFTSDPATLEIAVDYLIILGLSQVFMGVEIVLEGAFSGAGNTLPPMIISGSLSIMRLPLAYFFSLTLGWGINGIWWSLTITSFFKAVILLFWFRRGDWKKKQL
ncbi:MAG: MATE family efflux transporter [candidate division Zixibacteria bacterium]|nr:MATE family efflux transporter [candidate division Zixibacteria bacterium]